MGLNEMRHYTRATILTILGSSVIVCIGIKVLTSKPSQLAHIKKKDERHEEESQSGQSNLEPVHFEMDSNGIKSEYSGDEKEKQGKLRGAQIKLIAKVFYNTRN